MPVVLCDLDGVVWRGAEVISGAEDGINRLFENGFSIIFVTNNSFTPWIDLHNRLHQIVGHDHFGLVTSPLVSSHYIRQRYPIGTKLFVLGGVGLHEALTQHGHYTTTEAHEAAVVVVGLKRDFTFDELAAAHQAIVNGADFLAANDDPSFPTDQGSQPGAGALVAALERSTGKTAEVLGKPNEACVLYIRSLIPTDEELVVIGDRIDQDKGLAVGLDALFHLVLSGSTSLETIIPSIAAEINISNDLCAAASYIVENFSPLDPNAA